MVDRPVDSFKFPLAVDQMRGSIAVERDYNAHIKQLIVQVLLTSPGERINMPDFGAGLRRAVFSPNTTATASLLQTLITQNLNQWMGSLIQIDEVLTEAENEILRVTLKYTLFARGTSDVLNLEVRP